MAWTEVSVCYDKRLPDGRKAKTNELYMTNALTCTEAEANVLEHIKDYINGDCSVTKVTKSNTTSIYLDKKGDKYYKAKINSIVLDERTASEKKKPSYIMVQASDLESALDCLTACMSETLDDYEVESIGETKIIDIITRADDIPRI